jgi:predicted RNA binding protein YcfA (HicA-like mRNA interferase family)
MPRKLRELKADLRRAGFAVRSGTGSHTVWKHPLGRQRVTLSGGDSDDAQGYQERQVQAALDEVRDRQRSKP